MSLAPGTRIGPYEVISMVGAGGMGQVFRARDTRLKRDVALKVLPDSVANDSERLARFTREAQTLASLNHPNIAHTHGLEESGGVSALVMELVEGEDLSQRIARGPLPIDDALPIARQIAEALEAAHEQGIVHRDLKPANIKVRADGAVKVLDFGLAKAVSHPETSPNPSGLLPTITSPALMTHAGIILGTAAYMSPEQARGKAVDKRADIWAFGAVLFEMFSGTRAFPGEDLGETLAAVVKSEPDWNRLPAGIPAPIRTLLRRCLRKDPRQRLADAGAARIEIDDAMAEPAAGQPVQASASRRSTVFVAALGAVAIAGAAALAGARIGETRTAEVRPVVARLAMPLTAGTELSDGSSVVISPDGLLVAYVAIRGGITELYTRRLDGPEPRAVAGTRGAAGPFFSPDGQWLGFVADGKLKKVSTSGGVVVTLADAPSSAVAATWGPDDTIVFPSPKGLARVPAAGGDPHLLHVSQPETANGLRRPEFLPGGKTLLVASTVPGATTTRDISIELLTLDTGQRKTLIQGSGYAHYVPTGHLIFLVDGVLKAAPLDLEKQELVGTPVDLVGGVRQQQYSGSGAFSCSQSGTCVYIAGSTASSRTVTMVDRTGAAQALPFPAKSYTNPRFSPRGDRVAVWVEQLRCDIEVMDLARGTVTRLTSEGDNHYPIWTPDGQRITYLGQRTRESARMIVSRPANGSGAEEAVSATPSKYSPSVPLAWSSRGVLAFADQGSIWVMPHASEPQAFAPSPFDETAPAFSPDGRWLAYVSDESGRYDVYVRPFPGPGEKYKVSTAGGMEPVWSRNSRELFYRNGDQVLAVQAGTTPEFSASRPRVLFTGPFARARTADRIAYDVSPDGEHFVMLNSGEEDRAVTQISVLLNWFEELKARVPSK